MIDSLNLVCLFSNCFPMVPYALIYDVYIPTFTLSMFYKQWSNGGGRGTELTKPVDDNPSLDLNIGLAKKKNQTCWLMIGEPTSRLECRQWPSQLTHWCQGSCALLISSSILLWSPAIPRFFTYFFSTLF